MSFLYIGTFGSFIGYSAGFPLLMKTQFPDVNVLSYAFLGPLVGALSRSATGWISDRFGGGVVTFWCFVGMFVSVMGVLWFLPQGGGAGNFWGFFACFMALFFLTGVGNASTFQMIPAIMRRDIPRAMPELGADAALKTAEREAGAIIAFTSAMAAYGAFFIPKSYGTSIAMTGGPAAALIAFAAFYATCVAVTWWFYTRKGAATPC
jgi:NNP family nitrate/nitrite transporter-like MFS transporter